MTLPGLLAVAPLVSLAFIALSGQSDIWPHLAAYVLPHATQQTLLLLGGVAVITGVLGIGTAWAVTMFQFPGRDALIWLLPLPLAVPTYLVAYVYVDLLEPFGFVQNLLIGLFGPGAAGFATPSLRSLSGAVFLFGLVLYPYVYLAARAAFQTQSAAFSEAAYVSGARPVAMFRDIVLPLARPAVAVGIALALLETLNDVGASEYLGVQTLTLSIFATWLNRGSLAGAAQIACIMLTLVAALLWLERYGRRHRSYVALSQRPQPARRIALPRRSAIVVAALCFAPVLLGFGAPVLALLHKAVSRGLVTGFDPDLPRHALTTLRYAASATFIVIALGFAAVATLRFRRTRLMAYWINAASLGYAVPGAVLALGLLTPLVRVDDAINWLTESIAGVSVGLVFAGSGAAVVIAYVVRFLAIGIGFAQAGFDRMPRDFDDSALLMGATPLKTARTIHLPLTRPAIFGAALLVFVDCMKELPATLLLRPLNVETLATYLYQYAARGNFEAGALAAVLIVAIGIIPVIYIAHQADSATEALGAATPQADR